MIHHLHLDHTPQTGMSRGELADEARECRRRAMKFAGRPEHQFLLRLAAAFDTLLVAEEDRKTGRRRGHG